MKKILIIVLYLVTFNVKAEDKPITFNVDTFYSECKENKHANYISGYCLGYITGISNLQTSLRHALKSISPKCNYTYGELLERFFILYQRNQFEIGSSASVAIVESVTSLCPIISSEQYDKELKELPE